MGRKHKQRAFAVVISGAPAPNAPTLHQLQQGIAAGALARLLVAVAKAKAVPDAA